MKKVLFAFCAIAVIPALAQNSIDLTRTHSISDQNIIDQEQYVPVKKGAASVLSVGIGKASNAFSTLTPKTYLWADPGLNTITFTHRNDASSFGLTSGHLRYDVSKDGGQTWSTDQGPIWSPTGAVGALNGPARYPQGVIFNPTGNTDPDSAYLAFFAPSLNGTNAANSWGGQVLGSIQLDGTDLTNTEISSDPAASTFFQVASELTFSEANQKVYGLNQSEDVTSGSVVYTDSVILSTGTFNAATRSIDFAHEKLYFPFESDTSDPVNPTVLADTRIAFGPNGTTGYITGIGYLDDPAIAPFGVYSPAFLKTTDGGATWSAQSGVNLDNLMITYHGISLKDSLSNWFPTWQINAVSTAFDHDLVVDKNGNPHILANIMPSANNTIPDGGAAGGAFSVFSALNFVVDIYSLDGGSTWKAHVIDTASTFRGDYGADFSEDNRPQIARTADGSVIIYAFGDTDFSVFQTSENTNPDVKMRGLDIDTDVMGDLQIMTNNLQDKGTAHQFNLPHIIYDADANDMHFVPVTATKFTNDDITQGAQPVQYIYYDLMYNMTIDTSNISSISEWDINKGEISSLYPNPAGDHTWLLYTVKVPGKYSVEISDITGQILQYTDLGNTGSGEFKHKLNTENLVAGVYIVTLKTGKYTSSQRLIIQ